MIKKLKLKKRKGSALAYVIFIFLIASILATSFLFVLNTNVKQTARQKDRMEAYYLAYSGAEMAYRALLTPVGPGTTLKYTELTAGLTYNENNISYGSGNIDLQAKITADTNFPDWIEIKSTGKLSKNGVSYTRYLFFDPKNPINKVWKND